MANIDQPYLDLLQLILDKGKRVPTRAKLESTGQHVHALRVFGAQARFDLREGFPALTTKKIAWKAVVAELFWFLAGDTNARTLQAQNVHIWDQWADPTTGSVGPTTGSVGPVYGEQWRAWGPSNLDQLSELVVSIIESTHDEFASVKRRLLMTAWNPDDIPLMRLPSCHVLAQFDVTDGELSCHLYQRSADAFLGVPFNIASYALLTHLLARATGLRVGDFVHSFGDLHIYENHLEQVAEQLQRTPRNAPQLQLPELVYTGDRGRVPFAVSSGMVLERPLAVDDVQLVDYQHWPALRGEVAV